MTNGWRAFETAAGDLAARGRALLERTGSGEGLLATVRGDGPPRIHPVNVGKLSIGDPTALKPATPFGVQQMLIRSSIETRGAHAVIVGRSNIVGKPMASLLIQPGKGGDATVTVCHSKTRDLPAVCRSADILVVAMGKPEFVTADMVRPGATVIDVGINRVNDPAQPKGYRLVGDVAYAPVAEVAGAITPVPGGVGPMTIAMLLVNTVEAAEHAAGRR